MSHRFFGLVALGSGTAHQGLVASRNSLEHFVERVSRSGVRIWTTSDIAVESVGDICVLLAGLRPKWRGRSLHNNDIAKALCGEYQSRGLKCLELLSNDFALAIVDLRLQVCHVAVDRIGRWPLAYAQLANGFCFSSDARMVADSSKAELNAQALYDYTFFHAIPSPETAFVGVHKLLPAAVVSWENGVATSRQYWQPHFAESTSKSMDDLGQEFMTLIERAVADCEPDDRTASFLSGGIDSSTVTGMIAKLRGTGHPAYTMGFEQAGYDETEYARIAARQFGSDLRVHYVSTDEVQRSIADVAALYDEPFGNSSAVPTLICARTAKQQGIDRLLAGDGGDELFAGNTRYAKQRIFEVFWRLPAPLRNLLERTLLGESNPIARTPLRKVASYVQQARIPLPDRMESYNYLLRETQVPIFESEFMRQIDTDHPFQLLRDRYREPPKAATLDRLLYLDWKFTLADNDLRKVTATCRSTGVDVLYPWLDDEIIEFSARIPASLKMRGTKLRYFVKHALRDFLPRETLTKSKHGFGLPFGQWLKTSQALQSDVYELLTALGKRGIYREDFIRHLIAEHRTGHASYYGTMVWVLAMLEAWLQANHRR